MRKSPKERELEEKLEVLTKKLDRFSKRISQLMAENSNLSHRNKKIREKLEAAEQLLDYYPKALEVEWKILNTKKTNCPSCEEEFQIHVAFRGKTIGPVIAGSNRDEVEAELFNSWDLKTIAKHGLFPDTLPPESEDWA